MVTAIGFGLGCSIARKDDLSESLQIGLGVVCGIFAVLAVVSLLLAISYLEERN